MNVPAPLAVVHGDITPTGATFVPLPALVEKVEATVEDITSGFQNLTVHSVRQPSLSRLLPPAFDSSSFTASVLPVAQPVVWVFPPAAPACAHEPSTFAPTSLPFSEALAVSTETSLPLGAPFDTTAEIQSAPCLDIVLDSSPQASLVSSLGSPMPLSCASSFIPPPALQAPSRKVSSVSSYPFSLSQGGPSSSKSSLRLLSTIPSSSALASSTPVLAPVFSPPKSSASLSPENHHTATTLSAVPSPSFGQRITMQQGPAPLLAPLLASPQPFATLPDCMDGVQTTTDAVSEIDDMGIDTTMSGAAENPLSSDIAMEDAVEQHGPEETNEDSLMAEAMPPSTAVRTALDVQVNMEDALSAAATTTPPTWTATSLVYGPSLHTFQLARSATPAVLSQPPVLTSWSSKVAPVLDMKAALSMAFKKSDERVARPSLSDNSGVKAQAPMTKRSGPGGCVPATQGASNKGPSLFHNQARRGRKPAGPTAEELFMKQLRAIKENWESLKSSLQQYEEDDRYRGTVTRR